MSKEERQRILRERLRANRQRLARQTYLQQLPVPLQSYLEQCPIIQTPELETIVPWFWISANGVGKPSYQPAGYRFIEYSWPDQALAAARSLPSDYDDRLSYFWPSRDNPIYRVVFGWASTHLHELWSYSPQELGCVTGDYTTGFVISNYSGYLPEDPNPDEVVYEVALWTKAHA